MNISMQDFARRMGVKPSTVGAWRKRGMPSDDSGWEVVIPVKEALEWLKTNRPAKGGPRTLKAPGRVE